MENSITECGGVLTGEGSCQCSSVAVITCPAGKNRTIASLKTITSNILISITHIDNLSDETTTLVINNQTTVNSHESDTTVTSTESMSSTMTLQEPNTSTTIPVLAAVIGALVGLVTVALIVVGLVVVCRKRATVHQQR